jgi:Trp operon repressor
MSDIPLQASLPARTPLLTDFNYATSLARIVRGCNRMKAAQTSQ